MIPSREKRLLPFFAFLALFYAAYPFLAASAGGIAAVFRDHWPIALVMTLGSYFAGATPVGGGSVAFPILVLLFDQPPALGREFSFAIQSLGMTAAALFVLGSGRRIEWPFLRPALMGTLIGTPLGCQLIAPHAPPTAVRMIFASLWGAFGLFALLRLNRAAASDKATTPSEPSDFPALLTGFLGGLVASLIGGGADMIAFSYLALRRRLDPRIAIPTAMMLMAATSIIGLGLTLSSAPLRPGVWENWLAAAPIVVIGAPLGAFAVGFIPRNVAMAIVSLLCIAQFVWACLDRSGSAAVIAAACAAVAGIVVALRHLDTRPPKPGNL